MGKKNNRSLESKAVYNYYNINNDNTTNTNTYPFDLEVLSVESYQPYPIKL